MKQTPDKMNGVWVTPKCFFNKIQDEFRLEIDAAASAENAMLPKFWSQEIDALKQDWSSLRVWCNPPYGGRGKVGMYAWINKFATSRASVVVALLPARTDTKWFHDFIYRNPNVETRFIKGRIKFSNTNDQGKFPSMIVIFKS